MALLWDDVAADLASARRHFAQAVALYRGALVQTPDYVSAMAFQHAMQAGYTSFETGMRRLLHLLDEPMPVGSDWHAALVRRLGRAVPNGRPALLNPPLLEAVEELRRFRHVAMHAYDDFVARKAQLPVEAADLFLSTVDAAMTALRTAIDPPD